MLPLTTITITTTTVIEEKLSSSSSSSTTLPTRHPKGRHVRCSDASSKGQALQPGAAEKPARGFSVLPIHITYPLPAGNLSAAPQSLWSSEALPSPCHSLARTTIPSCGSTTRTITFFFFKKVPLCGIEAAPLPLPSTFPDFPPLCKCKAKLPHAVSRIAPPTCKKEASVGRRNRVRRCAGDAQARPGHQRSSTDMLPTPMALHS